MEIPKKYFHDRVILLLLSVDVFLAFLAVVFIVLKLGGSHGAGYIVQYRSNLGVSAFRTGGLSDLLSFVGFAVLVLVAHIVLSLRAYPIRRQLSVAILSLGVLLLVLCIIVSNALLVLR